jgi:hypothetical protein
LTVSRPAGTEAATQNPLPEVTPIEHSVRGFAPTSGAVKTRSPVFGDAPPFTSVTLAENVTACPVIAVEGLDSIVTDVAAGVTVIAASPDEDAYVLSPL